MIKVFLLSFVFIGALIGADAYKVVLKSFPKKPQDKKHIEAFRENFPQIKEPIVRRSGKFYILVIEPFYTKNEALAVAKKVRKYYKDAFVSPLSFEDFPQYRPQSKSFHKVISNNSSKSSLSGKSGEKSIPLSLEKNKEKRVQPNAVESEIKERKAERKKKAQNELEQKEPETGVKLKGSKEPPSWKQTIFTIAVWLIVGVGAILYFLRFRKLRLQLKRCQMQWKIEREKTKELNEYLKSSGAKQSEYIAKIVHELRSPLQAIIGLSEMIEEDAKSEDIKENIGYIKNSAYYLVTLVNDLLDLAQFQKGEFQITKKIFDLNEVLIKLRSVALMYAKGNGVNVDFYIGPRVPPYLQGDPVRLLQILINIVINAIKFSPNGKVLVKIYKVGGDKDRVQIAFEVEDNGVGMTQEQIQKLFDSFERFGESGVEGHGLGMSVVGQIVTAMGGKIDIQSVVGEGTSVTVTLPFTLYKRYAPYYRLPDERLKEKKICIVEDGTFNAEFLETFFKFLELKVERRKETREDLCQVVVLSAKKFFDIEPKKDIRYIIVKEFGESKDRLGADAIFYKPFTQQEVYEELMRVLLRA